MEAKLVAILAAFLLLSVSKGGDAQQCTVSDLAVTQTAMPGTVGAYRQFMVTVENTCICTQLNVKLECTGFNSTVNFDPAGVITLDGDSGLCSLNGGQPVHQGETVTFNYEWSTQVRFKPVGSTIACSAAPSPAPYAP